jgi:hypothetical protein
MATPAGTARLRDVGAGAFAGAEATAILLALAIRGAGLEDSLLAGLLGSELRDGWLSGGFGGFSCSGFCSGLCGGIGSGFSLSMGNHGAGSEHSGGFNRLASVIITASFCQNKKDIREGTGSPPFRLSIWFRQVN